MSDLTPRTSAFTLREVPARDEVIRIDAKGFHYLGQFIADAGEAYQLLVESLRKHRQAPQPVSVHERLPGPEVCVPHPRTKRGNWCWGFERCEVSLARPARWRLMHMETVEMEASHWLPAHALPLPEVGNG